MATFTATRGRPGFPVAGMGGGGDLKVAWGTYAIAANPVNTDVIQMCRTPRFATVIGGIVFGADIDTGTETLDFDAGYAANGVDIADPDAWGNFGVSSGDAITELIPVAGIWKPFQGILLTGGPKRLGAETIHTLTFNATANAGGTGQISMLVWYTLDP